MMKSSLLQRFTEGRHSFQRLLPEELSSLVPRNPMTVVVLGMGLVLCSCSPCFLL